MDSDRRGRRAVQAQVSTAGQRDRKLLKRFLYRTYSRTYILYAPMTYRRMVRDGDMSLTIPFVSISETGAVRLVRGVPTRTGSVARTTASPAGAGVGRGKSPGDSPLTSHSRPRARHGRVR